MSAETVVYHVSKDHIVIAPGEGWSVTIFNFSEKAIDALVSRDDGSETIRLHIDPPKEGQRMQIERSQESTEVNIRYYNV